MSVTEEDIQRIMHNAMCKSNHKRPFLVGVFLRHPHFDDTGFDTEILEPFRLMWAYSAKEMISIARDTLVPPQYDPALVSIVVEAVDHDERIEG